MKKTILFFLILIFLIDSASALAFETYTDTDKGFKIKYPSEWKYRLGEIIYLSFWADNYVSIQVYPENSQGMSLAQIKNKEKSVYLESGEVPYNEKDVTINSIKGFEWMVDGKYSGDVASKSRVVFLLSGDALYVIIAVAPESEYPKYSTIFNEVINSFEIMRTSTETPTQVQTPYQGVPEGAEPPKTPGFGVILAIVSIFGIARFAEKRYMKK